MAVVAILITMSSCNSATQIEMLETAYFKTDSTQGNAKIGMELIREYSRFYQNNVTDSLGIDMLYKAAEVSMGIGQGNLAVKYFRTISDDHSDYYKAPEALFLSGFCSENLNNDIDQARFFYEQFIKQYPNHKLAQDAKFSIQNLGKSDEELIKMFERNLAKESE